jgi:hypothetical protein
VAETDKLVVTPSQRLNLCALGPTLGSLPQRTVRCYFQLIKRESTSLSARYSSKPKRSPPTRKIVSKWLTMCQVTPTFQIFRAAVDGLDARLQFAV